MIRVLRTPAGRHFIDFKKQYFSINGVPNRVRSFLSRMREEQIFELAAEMVYFRMIFRFRQYNYLASKPIEDVGEFFSLHQREHYPDLSDSDEMIKYMIEMVQTTLKAMIAAHDGFWKIDSDECIYEIMEQQVSGMRDRKRIKKMLRPDMTDSVIIDPDDDKSLHQLIMETIDRNDYGRLGDYLKQYERTMERMSN